MPIRYISDLTLEEAIKEYRRQRWIAIEQTERGQPDRATDGLKRAVELRQRIIALDGVPPY